MINEEKNKRLLEAEKTLTDFKEFIKLLNKEMVIKKINTELTQIGSLPITITNYLEDDRFHKIIKEFYIISKYQCPDILKFLEDERNTTERTEKE